MIEQTASAYVFEGERVLLIHHGKLGKWFGPGGHCEAGELPHQTAIREVKEETGLEIELMHDERVWITPQFNGSSIPRPAFMLLENIPAYKEVPPHFHLDFVFIARRVGGELKPNDELAGIGWYTHEEIRELEMFQETRDVLAQLYPWHRLSVQTKSFAPHENVPLLQTSDAIEQNLQAAPQL